VSETFLKDNIVIVLHYSLVNGDAEWIHPSYPLFECDIRNADLIKTIRENRIDGVINLAGLKSAKNS
jgi:hypothetical protein